MLVQSMVIFFLGIIDNVCRLHYSDPEFVLVEQHPQEKCIICRTHCVAFQMDVLIVINQTCTLGMPVFVLNS